jgi:hypothetical protein
MERLKARPQLLDEKGSNCCMYDTTIVVATWKDSENHQYLSTATEYKHKTVKTHGITYVKATYSESVKLYAMHTGTSYCKATKWGAFMDENTVQCFISMPCQAVLRISQNQYKI